ncbi:hypothetical protein HanRHA438_Chr09g0403531 [Helianthus annuus]|uniref:Uncharacterized protein n=1 Tax=Helianthus annuus TaxID=4232 RepID=A0A251T015_HELAN|nr:hypothetical protein HanXRQr2_Chr09g0391801 [Helianthus annuus]KAJ0526299.1 hypothetical protein HanHA300_Chr09g0321601 [Helianthus annuus]KAJ0534700.1 hypothetical protein HanIR_Chr09g0422641 [Helianthus annuus]KAJ0542690.1 hypothetical protein HanHA89_Chr09g0342551 [Helianthus annuus]KAJ0707750.1 hypothetical protein HanLR1_Chr09g0321881 [Helianthus annuus]
MFRLRLGKWLRSQLLWYWVSVREFGTAGVGPDSSGFGQYSSSTFRSVGSGLVISGQGVQVFGLTLVSGSVYVSTGQFGSSYF